MVADQAATDLGVSWSRTSPVVVSAGDEAYSTYITLECDHKMGMSVSGDSGNVKAFRFACSSAISPLEDMVMKTLFPNDQGSSVTVGMGEQLLNGSPLDIYMSNGYLVMKSANSTDKIIVIDPETGVVRDILNSSLYGAYCFGNQQTEWAIDLCERILTNLNMRANIVCNNGVIEFSGEWISGGKNNTCSVRINSESALDAIVFELVAYGIILGACTGSDEVALALAAALPSVASLVISTLKGDFNQMWEDAWLQVKVNDQTVYNRHLVFDGGSILPN